MGRSRHAPLAPPELIESARRGDLAALEQLIRVCQEPVGAFVLRQIGQRDDCLDVCQDIFVKMMHALPRLRSPALFEPWLFSLARNACLDVLRTRRRRERCFTLLKKDHLDVPDLPATEGRATDVLDAVVEQLESSQREVLVLSLESKRSYDQISQLTGLSVAAVRNRLFRARERLRRLIRRKERP